MAAVPSSRLLTETTYGILTELLTDYLRTTYGLLTEYLGKAAKQRRPQLGSDVALTQPRNPRAPCQSEEANHPVRHSDIRTRLKCCVHSDLDFQRQQGLVATCEDFSNEAKSRSRGELHGDWRMSP
jgi:hypothetical protein